MNLLPELKQVSWLKIAVYGLLISGLYLASFKFLSQEWQNDDFTYCYLIPPVVLYLLWEKREHLFGIIPQPSWAGFVFIVFGIFLFWFGELGGEYFTLFMSFWFVLVGLFWIHFGWNSIVTIWFPLIMVLTAFTPPDFLYFRLTLKLKLISSQLGVAMIQAYGMSAYREGNIIDLGFTQLQVVDACSGLRYLFPLLIMGILLAHLYRAAWWKKMFLIISTVPLTIFTNSLRIAMTGILFELWGPDLARGFFHGFSGWFIFMFGLVVILLEMWALNGFKTFRSLALSSSLKENSDIDSDSAPHILDLRSESGADDESRISKRRNLTGGVLKPLLRPPQFVVAVFLLGATLVLAQGVEFRENIPPNKSLSQFPLKIDGWSGKRAPMEQRFVDALDFSDYVIVDYQNSSGKQINFYAAYYESQQKGESIHSPASCLPGSGWVFESAGSFKIPISNKKNDTMPVNRAYMLKNDFRQLSYYWFPQRGRILTNTYQLKLYAFWDALTRQRTDGALVRVITPVYQDENLENAEKRLREFTRQLVPVLVGFLPD